MRRFLFTSLSAISLLATIGSVSPAVAARYCLQGPSWGYPGNCQFSSLRECRATASGTNASCGRNPRYAYARQRGNVGAQPPVNNGWNNNGWNNNYGWNNSGWNNPGWNGNPNNRPGLVGGSDVGTYRP
jgi:Protein of unknown function (DUF3551)